MINYYPQRTSTIREKAGIAGCTTRDIADAYATIYFEGNAHIFFDTPNVRPLVQQQPLEEHRQGYSEDEEDEYEEEEERYSTVDERESSRQSGTTQASESNEKPFIPKGRGKMTGCPRRLRST
eukprot:3817199-Amphidinium_carterae.1